MLPNYVRRLNHKNSRRRSNDAGIAMNLPRVIVFRKYIVVIAFQTFVIRLCKYSPLIINKITTFEIMKQHINSFPEVSDRALDIELGVVTLCA